MRIAAALVPLVVRSGAVLSLVCGLTNQLAASQGPQTASELPPVAAVRANDDSVRQTGLQVADAGNNAAKAAKKAGAAANAPATLGTITHLKVVLYQQDSSTPPKDRGGLVECTIVANGPVPNPALPLLELQFYPPELPNPQQWSSGVRVTSNGKEIKSTATFPVPGNQANPAGGPQRPRRIRAIVEIGAADLPAAGVAATYVVQYPVQVGNWAPSYQITAANDTQLPITTANQAGTVSLWPQLQNSSGLEWPAGTTDIFLSESEATGTYTSFTLNAAINEGKSAYVRSTAPADQIPLQIGLKYTVGGDTAKDGDVIQPQGQITLTQPVPAPATWLERFKYQGEVSITAIDPNAPAPAPGPPPVPAPAKQKVVVTITGDKFFAQAAPINGNFQLPGTFILVNVALSKSQTESWILDAMCDGVAYVKMQQTYVYTATNPGYAITVDPPVPKDWELKDPTSKTVIPDPSPAPGNLVLTRVQKRASQHSFTTTIGTLKADGDPKSLLAEAKKLVVDPRDTCRIDLEDAQSAIVGLVTAMSAEGPGAVDAKSNYSDVYTNAAHAAPRPCDKCHSCRDEDRIRVFKETWEASVKRVADLVENYNRAIKVICVKRACCLCNEKKSNGN